VGRRKRLDFEIDLARVKKQRDAWLRGKRISPPGWNKSGNFMTRKVDGARLSYHRGSYRLSVPLQERRLADAAVQADQQYPGRDPTLIWLLEHLDELHALEPYGSRAPPALRFYDGSPNGLLLERDAPTPAEGEWVGDRVVNTAQGYLLRALSRAESLLGRYQLLLYAAIHDAQGETLSRGDAPEHLLPLAVGLVRRVRRPWHHACGGPFLPLVSRREVWPRSAPQPAAVCWGAAQLSCERLLRHDIIVSSYGLPSRPSGPALVE